MLKTYQFKTHRKGDIVIKVKR